MDANSFKLLLVDSKEQKENSFLKFHNVQLAFRKLTLPTKNEQRRIGEV